MTVKLTIDGKDIEVEEGTSILNACKIAHKEIPVFCYHPRLNIAGNCRMCLVEIEHYQKPIASCSTNVSEGMVIYTKSQMVEESRKGVLELLLINHPLDCPICDQGGECDLQDISMNYGTGNSRYKFYKRAVSNKYMGPFIKTVMNRCIHCTRCIRFGTEIAGIEEIGTKGRGENTEIISYLEKAITSELSGNIIDICPVGALTNKPYAFHGRPWELTHTNSIDVLDAVGSNIRIDTRDNQVLRIMPRTNDEINEEWIGDKTRFAYDGLSYQRLDKPYIRKNKKLVPCTWNEAFETIANKIKKLDASEIGALSGDLSDQESQLALKILLDQLNVKNRDCRVDGAMLSFAHRSHYLFNTTIKDIEHSDAVLLIGCNPRVEATIVNMRLRKAVVKNNCIIGLIGEPVDLTYPYENLGNSQNILDDIIKGTHPFSKKLKNAKKPSIIFGISCFLGKNAPLIFPYINKLHQKFAAQINILHTAAGRVGGLDIGFVPAPGGKNFLEIVESTTSGSIKLLYLLNVDIDVDFGKAFIIYQGHHGDKGAQQADVILPGAAFSEKTATYVNMEGRSQRTNQALLPPGDAKEDWKIIRALAEKIGKTLPFDFLPQLQELLPESTDLTIAFEPLKTNSINGRIEHFNSININYYMHDVISRYSINMVNAVREIQESKRGNF